MAFSKTVEKYLLCSLSMFSSLSQKTRSLKESPKNQLFLIPSNYVRPSCLTPKTL